MTWLWRRDLSLWQFLSLGNLFYGWKSILDGLLGLHVKTPSCLLDSLIFSFLHLVFHKMPVPSLISEVFISTGHPEGSLAAGSTSIAWICHHDNYRHASSHSAVACPCQTHHRIQSSYNLIYSHKLRIKRLLIFREAVQVRAHCMTKSTHVIVCNWIHHPKFMDDCARVITPHCNCNFYTYSLHFCRSPLKEMVVSMD